MAKNITLQSIEIREVRFRPNDPEPNVVLFYNVVDAGGNIVGEKQHNVLVADLVGKMKGAITSLSTQASTLLEDKDVK